MSVFHIPMPKLQVLVGQLCESPRVWKCLETDGVIDGSEGKPGSVWEVFLNKQDQHLNEKEGKCACLFLLTVTIVSSVP